MQIKRVSHSFIINSSSLEMLYKSNCLRFFLNVARLGKVTLILGNEFQIEATFIGF